MDLQGRGLHSSTYQLNVNAFCRIGDALRGCLGGVWAVLRAIGGVEGVSETAQIELKSGRV